MGGKPLNSNDLRIDSHKLMYHPRRIVEWLDKKNIYPIYAEVAPTSSCNHRCVFCAFDYMNYQPKFLKKDVFMKTFDFLSKNGLKSIMFAGEGEPFMNKETPDLIEFAKKKGLDISVTTNGVLMSQEITKRILGLLSWVRISLNAGNRQNYSKIHGCTQEDFDIVMDNIKYAVYLKKRQQYKTKIGVQLLLIKDNLDDVLSFSKDIKKIGVDYYSIKPYSQHPESINRFQGTLDYKECYSLEKELKKEETDDFKIFFRADAIKRLSISRKYNKCLGNSFWTYIDANEKVWSCSAFLGINDYCFGDLNEKTFDEIWNSERRKKILESINAKNCREICRLDSINNYLYRILNPKQHDNFI